MRGAVCVAVTCLALLAACGGSAREVGAAAPPSFRHVVVVVFENEERSAIVGNPAAPTFAMLARRYASLSNYTGVAHPSLPNYLALVSGSTHGITDDCVTCSVGGRSLASTLGRVGKSWKAYAEGLPYPGFLGATAGRYAKKHLPFLYFTGVAGAPALRKRVVPFAALRHDLARGALPTFALVVPDRCHDMHDCSVATGDRWLRNQIVPLLDDPALAHSVVFVVFDEGSKDDGDGGGGAVAALALGPLVRPGAVSSQPVDHYNLLRTVEDGLGLPRLGLSAGAAPVTGIWRAGARR